MASSIRHFHQSQHLHRILTHSAQRGSVAPSLWLLATNAKTYSTKTTIRSNTQTTAQKTIIEDDEDLTSPFDKLLGSTPTSKSAAKHAPSSQESKPTLPSNPALSWQVYLQLRKNRKTYERIASTMTGTTSFLSGGYYISFVREFDPTELVFGIDPSLAYTVLALGIGATGAAVGTGIGRTIWNLVNRSILQEMTIRDKLFTQFLTRWRAPATSHSVDTPVPDYYGEKIKDIQSLRGWVRKQRKHMEKVGAKRE